MATEANIGIKASLSTMWSSGRRYWTRIFAASVITIALLTIGLIVIIGIVFFVSTIVAGPIDPTLLAGNGFNPSSLPASFAAVIMAGVLAILIFLLAFQLGFTLVDFAVVIDDLSAVSSIKRSISFFRYNPFDVFVLWLVTIGISMALSLPGQILAKDFYAFWSMISTAISIFVIGPLTIVWWARLYMTRSGIFNRKDPEEETTYIWT
jgi:hypothetical protein